MVVHSPSTDEKIVSSISARVLNTFTLELSKLVLLTSTHDGLIDNDKI